MIIISFCLQELLALEDEIGIVSTALSEEELSKCVRMSVYKPLHTNEPRMRDDWCMDNTKCSICQVIFQTIFNLSIVTVTIDI